MDINKAVAPGSAHSRAGRGLLLAISLAAIGESACAMSPAKDQGWQCTVEAAAKLPPGVRDAEVCAAMKDAAVAAVGPALVNSGAVSVRVTIRSEHIASALPTLRGHTLPEQKLAVSDRALSMASIKVLAKAVGNELARSSR